LFSARARQAIGIVLKVDPWVTHEQPLRTGLQHPRKCLIGKWPTGEYLLVPLQIRTERSIEAKDRTGGQAAFPERLSVLQTRKIKVCPSMLIAKPVQHPPIEAGFGGR